MAGGEIDLRCGDACEMEDLLLKASVLFVRRTLEEDSVA